MLGVKQRECDSWNIKSCRAKIIYPGIEAGRKCYLQGLRSVRKIADPGFKNCVRIFQAGKNLLFGHVEKRLDYKYKVNFKIYDVTVGSTSNYNKHIDQYLKK